MDRAGKLQGAAAHEKPLLREGPIERMLFIFNLPEIRDWV